MHEIQPSNNQVAEALAAGTYIPSDLGDGSVGFEVWVGFVAGVIPFAIGSWEFGKRIVSQLGVSWEAVGSSAREL